MAVGLLVMNIFALCGGLATGFCALACTKLWAARIADSKRIGLSVCSFFPGIAGLIGLIWTFSTPPIFSVEISGPPAHRRNDPIRSVYVGNGCFWHTQYDFVLLEQDVNGPFGGRSDANVTSLVGYAGGRHQSTSGAVCYHGFPHSDYGKLGHAEAMSISLDSHTGSVARAQVSAIAKIYFEHGFNTVDGGKRQRLDPQDAGKEYRNVLGLPGGMDNGELWPLFEAANLHGMPLVRGTGGNQDDTEDEYVVYVYDSNRYPFFRGESSHQFHANSVIGRDTPESYRQGLHKKQSDMGRLDSTGCVDMGLSEIGLLITCGFASALSFGIMVPYVCLPSWLHCCSCWGKWRGDECAERPHTVEV